MTQIAWHTNADSTTHTLYHFYDHAKLRLAEMSKNERGHWFTAVFIDNIAVGRTEWMQWPRGMTRAFLRKRSESLSDAKAEAVIATAIFLGAPPEDDRIAYMP